jgi:hypothetical protein
MTIFHIAIYKFSAVLIMKLPITFFIQIEKSPATHKEFQKTPKAKSILLSKKKKKIRAQSITIPDFKLYYRGVLTKAGLYWQKNRPIDQSKGIEDSEVHIATAIWFLTKVPRNTLQKRQPL